jgi:hypothetical protein
MTTKEGRVFSTDCDVCRLVHIPLLLLFSFCCVDWAFLRGNGAISSPKALTKSQKRRLVREEKRKAAISEQRDKDALKLAIVLGEQTGSDGADVSQSEQDTGRPY